MSPRASKQAQSWHQGMTVLAATAECEGKMGSWLRMKRFLYVRGWSRDSSKGTSGPNCDVLMEHHNYSAQFKWTIKASTEMKGKSALWGNDFTPLLWLVSNNTAWLISLVCQPGLCCLSALWGDLGGCWGMGRWGSMVLSDLLFKKWD